MGAGMLVLIVMGITTCGALVAHANQGIDSYYSPPYIPSACYGNQNEGDMIAAATNTFWNGGHACGTDYQVTCTGAMNEGVLHPCTGATVTVTIVDYCPGCPGDIALSQDAFAVIANLLAGTIQVEYNQV